MEIVLAAVVAAVVAMAVVLVAQRSSSRGGAEGGVLSEPRARRGGRAIGAEATHDGEAGDGRPAEGPAGAAEGPVRPVTPASPTPAAEEPVSRPREREGRPGPTSAPARAAQAASASAAEAATPAAAGAGLSRVPDRGATAPLAGSPAGTAEAPVLRGEPAPSVDAPAEPEGAPAGALHDHLEAELRERRAELGRMEERLLGKEQSIDARLAEIERAERVLEDRERNVRREAERLKQAKAEHRRELERISGLTAAQAKQILLRELEDELRHDSARMIRQAEEEVRRDADRRARNILSTAMQRLAGGHAAETTVSVVPLPSDDMKGRVIGREGRNIRALETVTGIDFIIDDTPSAVILSGFDGMRREIARLTLEKLLEDGRIHPARIEEAFEQARAEMEEHVVEVGEQAAFDANVGSIHPELVKLLGRLHYRTSYGQNVLSHSVEVSRLAGMIAAELGANPKTARRAALMHDVGKAVTHELEGPHALVGGELARRYGESEAVAHAMEAHHNEVEMQTVEAVIVQVADALSGARPGARGESLEQYVKRLRDLEGIAERHPGVEKVYAMQAGREVRVIVSPENVDDDAAALISHKIARDVERELEYPGQIKVTVIRESRAVDYAK